MLLLLLLLLVVVVVVILRYPPLLRTSPTVLSLSLVSLHLPVFTMTDRLVCVCELSSFGIHISPFQMYNICSGRKEYGTWCRVCLTTGTLDKRTFSFVVCRLMTCDEKK